MVEKRTERRRKVKRRKRKTILSFVLILFLCSLIFVIYEYWAGMNSAEEDASQYRDEEKSNEYENEFQGTEPINDRTNVLILGEDSDAEGVSRTDTIMIGQYDSENNRAKLVSIMRDTYVNIPGYGYNKINAAFALGGPELLRQTIKDNFHIDIHYYAIVNFRGFERIVDTIAPEGIEINVEKRMYYHDKKGDVTIDLQPGLQRLDGEHLLDYARFRADAESDFGRVRRQQQVMRALKEEVVSFTNVLKLPRAVGTLQPYIDTNMKTNTILAIATDFLLSVPDEIETMRIPVDDSWWNATHDHAGAVLEIDEETNIDALQKFLNGSESMSEQTQSGSQ